MSFTPIYHVHGALHVIVGATGNNSLISISKDFYWFSWEVPCMGLQVPFAPHHLVFFVTVTIYLERLRPIKLIKQKQNKNKMSASSSGGTSRCAFNLRWHPCLWRRRNGRRSNVRPWCKSACLNEEMPWAQYKAKQRKGTVTAERSSFYRTCHHQRRPESPLREAKTCDGDANSYRCCRGPTIYRLHQLPP